MISRNVALAVTEAVEVAASPEALRDARPVAPLPTRRPTNRESAIRVLRRRLGTDSKSVVLLDFLDDDLRESETTLATLVGELDALERFLADPSASRDDLVALALDGGALERMDYLIAVVGNLRRRLVQLAGRL